MENYYECLGVGRQATAQELKQAYRTLAKRYHPDRNKGSAEATQKFKQVQEAYEVLSNEETRRKYDESLANRAKQRGASSARTERGATQQTRGAKSPTFNPEQMQASFEQFFGFHPKSGSPANKKNPIDTSDLFNRFFDTGKK